jgi:hypothetical protein
MSDQHYSSKDAQKKQSIFDIVTQNTELFKDENGALYSRIRVNGHKEILGIETDRFKQYITKLYYDNCNGESMPQDMLRSVIDRIKAKASFDSETRELHLRVAWEVKEQKIIYDLTDSSWRCAEITKDGWRIIPESPVLFNRFNAKAQAEPSTSYDVKVFDRFLDLGNIKDSDSRILVKVWIVSLFIPDISHAINNLHGEKGASKSTLSSLIKDMVDPSILPLLSIPTMNEQFAQHMHHNYLVVYDNVKGVPGWLSDEICKAITGIGILRRKLYTDTDAVAYNYKRCIIINGINNCLTESDALDRAILTEVSRITADKRRELAQVIAEFEKMKPELLGYIFDVLSKALVIKPDVSIKEIPRMADFAVWGEAISRVMGYEPHEFLDAYYRNIGKQNAEAIEEHPLGTVLLKFLEDMENDGRRLWQGSSDELLHLLQETVRKHSMNVNQNQFPKAGNALVRKLNQIKSNLSEGLGITVQIDRTTSGTKKNYSMITIQKISGRPASGDDAAPPSDKHQLIGGENQTRPTESGDDGESGDSSFSLESNREISNDELQLAIKAVLDEQIKRNASSLRKVEALVEIGAITKDYARARAVFDQLVKTGMLESMGADSYSVKKLSSLSPPHPPVGSSSEA